MSGKKTGKSVTITCLVDDRLNARHSLTDHVMFPDRL